jgi:hypothetical protein
VALAGRARGMVHLRVAASVKAETVMQTVLAEAVAHTVDELSRRTIRTRMAVLQAVEVAARAAYFATGHRYDGKEGLITGCTVVAMAEAAVKEARVVRLRVDAQKQAAGRAAAIKARADAKAAKAAKANGGLVFNAETGTLEARGASKMAAGNAVGMVSDEDEVVDEESMDEPRTQRRESSAAMVMGMYEFRQAQEKEAIRNAAALELETAVREKRKKSLEVLQLVIRRYIGSRRALGTGGIAAFVDNLVVDTKLEAAHRKREEAHRLLQESRSTVKIQSIFRRKLARRHFEDKMEQRVEDNLHELFEEEKKEEEEEHHRNYYPDGHRHYYPEGGRHHEEGAHQEEEGGRHHEEGGHHQEEGGHHEEEREHHEEECPVLTGVDSCPVDPRPDGPFGVISLIATNEAAVNNLDGALAKATPLVSAVADEKAGGAGEDAAADHIVERTKGRVLVGTVVHRPVPRQHESMLRQHEPVLALSTQHHPTVATVPAVLTVPNHATAMPGPLTMQTVATLPAATSVPGPGEEWSASSGSDSESDELDAVLQRTTSVTGPSVEHAAPVEQAVPILCQGCGRWECRCYSAPGPGVTGASVEQAAPARVPAPALARVPGAGHVYDEDEGGAEWSSDSDSDDDELDAVLQLMQVQAEAAERLALLDTRS